MDFHVRNEIIIKVLNDSQNFSNEVTVKNNPDESNDNEVSDLDEPSSKEP